MKRILSLALCCILILSGCGSSKVTEFEKEIPNETGVILEPPKYEIQPYEPVDKIKPIEEQKDEVQIQVEEPQVAVEETVNLNLDEFKEVDIPINLLRPIKIEMSVYGSSFNMGVDSAFGNMFIEVVNNKYVYQDGVNYTVIGRQYHKWEGPNVMDEDSEDAVTDMTGVDLEESVKISKVYDATQTGDIITLKGYYVSEDGDTPATAVVDANNHELISFDIEDEENNMYVSIIALDVWKPLPDVDFEEVDKETISAESEQVMMGIFSMLLTGAFSEMGNMDLSNTEDDSNTLSVNIDDVFKDADWSAIENIEDDLNSRYGIDYYSYVALSGSVTYSFIKERDLTEVEIESVKEEITTYLKSLPGTTLK